MNQPSYIAIADKKNQRWFRSLFVNALLFNAVSLLCFHQNVIAETRYSHFSNSINNNYSNQSPVDFSLSFSLTDIDLESNDNSYPVSQTRISAILLNRVSSNLNLGLIIGSNYSSFDNDPTTAGFSLSGNHIGFLINQTFGNELQIGMHAYYIYQQAKGENTLRTATLTWHEWLAEASLRLRLGTHWAIIAGGGIMGIDTDQKIKGDINETVKLKLADSFQGRMAVEVLTSPADRIRLTMNRGAFDSVQLTFAHAF